MKRAVLLGVIRLGSSCALAVDDDPSQSVDDAPPVESVEQKLQSTPKPFALFESGHVRPLAMSPDKKRLFAVNTPDNRVEIYDIKPSGLKHRASVAVGLEPVAVAARNSDEIWVVNHLSD